MGKIVVTEHSTKIMVRIQKQIHIFLQIKY
jgi:hypothetical protein